MFKKYKGSKNAFKYLILNGNLQRNPRSRHCHGALSVMQQMCENLAILCLNIAWNWSLFSYYCSKYWTFRNRCYGVLSWCNLTSTASISAIAVFSLVSRFFFCYRNSRVLKTHFRRKTFFDNFFSALPLR